MALDGRSGALGSLLLSLPFLVAFLSPARAADFPFSMPATANIYGAGHSVVPNPAGNGGGTLPVEIALPAGTGRTLTFDAVSGSIDYGACCAANGPDGIASAGTGPMIDWDGIAGMTIPRGRFLSAVFLDDSEPADPPPAQLVFADIGFATLSPGLRQSFFVGDGLDGTGSGSPQVFDVPDGATRLFLGLHDAGPPDTSVPGFYDDNSGTVTGTVVVAVTAPKPAPALGPWGLGLLALGLALAGGPRQKLTKRLRRLFRPGREPVQMDL